MVLAEAYAKGFRGFDLDLANEAAKKNATVPQKGDRTCDWRDRGEFGRTPETRGGLSRYMELGYVACDETRKANGQFLSPDEASDTDVHYCEQNPVTGIWAVPFDPDGVARLLGGKEAAAARLDDFFGTQFWKGERGNRSIHGNEPSHHCAYLYNRFGHPEKTQQRVREILTRAYSTSSASPSGTTLRIAGA